MDTRVYNNPTAMEPLLPRSDVFADLVLELSREAGALTGRLNPITRKSVAQLLRYANSYYSNLIEGHHTHPLDIDRAMREDYDADPAKRVLQLESRAHIEVQTLIDARLDEEPNLNIASPEFLCWIHAEFYRRLPDELRWVEDRERTRRIEVVPGTLRDGSLKVGRHVAPDHRTLGRFMARFAEAYDLGRLHGIDRIVAIAASHHRLLWIHPFYDGNGRVTRLFTYAFLRRTKLDGAGLWSVSRGLARERSRYIDSLAAADITRRDDYDGSGNLSERELVNFCEFFLRTCLDQVRYMGGLLEVGGLSDRIMGYAQLRARGLTDEPSLRPEAGLLLREAMLRGEIERGEAARITGLGTRSARKILSKLVSEGLLVSDTPKGPVRMGFPARAAGYLFPKLYPEGTMAPT